MATVKYANGFEVSDRSEFYERLKADYKAKGTTAPQQKTVDRLLDYITDDVFALWVKEQTEKVANSTIEARRITADLRNERNALCAESMAIRAEIDQLTQQQQAVGATDPDLLKPVNLYRTLIDLGKKAGADPNWAVREAGYLTWAYMTNGAPAPDKSRALLDAGEVSE